MAKIDAGLQEKLSVLISSMGYEFLGCESGSMGGKRMFRLFIDGPKGVNADDCSAVSRQISALMDVEDPFQSRYVLEVSSPGIDRPLFELKHYERFIGSEVKMKLYAPIEGRRQFGGILQRVVGENIHLDVSGQEMVIPFSAIERANIIGKVQF